MLIVVSYDMAGVDGAMAGVAGRVWTRQKDLNGGGMRSNLYAKQGHV